MTLNPLISEPPEPVSLATSVKRGGDQGAVASTREAISRALQADPVSGAVRTDVNRLVSEVVENLTRGEDPRLVQIETTVGDDGAVTVAVTGAPSDPLDELVQAPGPEQGTRATKRILTVLDSIASTWGTRRTNGTTTVWFTTAATDTGPAGPTSSLNAPMDSPVAALDETAIHAASVAESAARDAAAATADAAASARTARATAATVAADAVAEAAVRTMNLVQAQADELASVVAAAALTQAGLVAQSVTAGGEAEAERRARQIQQTVMTTAAVTAEQTARAAVLVAHEVAATAAAVADTTKAAAATMEQEVLDAAEAVKAVTTVAAEHAAAEAMERGEAVALVTRQAGAATQRLQQAHLQLQRAGLHDRMVALALQEAMLTRLPESDDLQLAARYLTAAEQDQVGGDWYDALTLPSGTTTVVIGDVIGHDIKAAATMGQLRNVLRTLVWDRNETPGSVLTRLDRANRDLSIDTMATLVVVNIEAPSPDEPTSIATLRWSNAGHPGPLLIRPGGRVIALDDATDILLGVRPSSVRRDHSYAVPPGATLFLYTDGLVETRNEGFDVGQGRLLDSLHNHHHLAPADLLDAVLNDMVGNQPEDDVAVLAVRFTRAEPSASHRVTTSRIAAPGPRGTPVDLPDRRVREHPPGQAQSDPT